MLRYWSETVTAMPATTIAEIDARSRAIMYAAECGACGADLTEPTEDGQSRVINSDLCGPCCQAVDLADILLEIERGQAAKRRAEIRARRRTRT